MHNEMFAAPSISGWRWRLRDYDHKLAMALSQRIGVPDMVGRLLALRGVQMEEADIFLVPSLRGSMPDPSLLKDMDKAAVFIAEIISSGGRIGVFGDYDVDGATSAALLVRFMRLLGAVEPVVYIPDRIKEGYGPNINAMDELKAQNLACVITVDCGALAFEVLAHARKIGLDIIVADHHIGEPRLPEAAAVVNPNRFDENSGLGHLAAVGVVFLLLVAVTRALRQRGWFASRTEPDLLGLLDIVALGTVCDVVPLKGLNRAFVAQGLKIMARRGNIGLKTLMDVARLEDAPTTYHLGYVLGPRINAGGRVGQADLGVKLLTTESETEAMTIARQLDLYNSERRAIEAEVQEAALSQLDRIGQNMPVLFAYGEAWHPGVIGIVAGRLKEKFNRPVAVIALDNGIGKASARSVSGVDFGSAVHAAHAEGLVLAGGGHAMAAGFSVEQNRIDDLQRFLCDRMGAAIDAKGDRTLNIDAILTPSSATPELLAQIGRLEPFGTGNAEPRFALKNALVIKADLMGNGEHVRLLLTDGDMGGRVSPARLKAMAFRIKDSPLALLPQLQGRKIHAAGKLKLNSWQGRDSVEMVLDDVMLL
jgi:single-stranded-DNA-specific exonuclease